MTSSRANNSSNLPALTCVILYMFMARLSIKFDYNICRRTTRGKTNDKIENALRDQPLNLEILQDEIIHHARLHGFSTSDAKAAFRRFLDLSSAKAYARIWRPLINPEQNHDREAAAIEWSRVDSLFSAEVGLASTAHQSFIWQCKRKAINMEVTWHIMPVIVAVQGAGKTTYVRLFTAPLHELVSPNVVFSDIVDKRSAEIFRYAVAVIEDMEKLPAKALPVLKSVITAVTLSRRILGTSKTGKIAQRCTFIGTSNEPVQRLVEDDTGHRRFLNLEFQNGGDQHWKTVMTIDFELLWRSVDPMAPNPIEAIREKVAAHQARYAGRDIFLEWLESLDFQSEALRGARMHRGYRSESLRLNFMKYAGEDISQKRFAQKMETYFRHDGSPFGDKSRDRDGWFYLLKASQSGRDT